MKKQESTSTRRLYRQGDVMFVKIARLPQNKLTKRASGVVAYGEVTGHSHALALEDRDVAEVLEMESQLFVHVGRSDRGGATFVHEEHGPVTLPAGDYRVVIQREYTPEKIRPVTD
jgi:hypothetical protein